MPRKMLTRRLVRNLALVVLELVLLGWQAITPVMSSSSEIIQLDWQVAGDSAVRAASTPRFWG